MGHAFGLGHVRSTAALRNDVNFMMNPSYQVQHMSEAEKTAIATARAHGRHAPGWRRNDALAAGLVLPNPSALIPAVRRTEHDQRSVRAVALQRREGRPLALIALSAAR